jgi:hypothetical protein
VVVEGKTYGTVGALESWEELSADYQGYGPERNKIRRVKAWRGQKTDLKNAFRGVGIDLKLVIRAYREWARKMSMMTDREGYEDWVRENIMRIGKEVTSKIERSMSILMESLSD